MPEEMDLFEEVWSATDEDKDWIGLEWNEAEGVWQMRQKNGAYETLVYLEYEDLVALRDKVIEEIERTED